MQEYFSEQIRSVCPEPITEDEARDAFTSALELIIWVKRLSQIKLAAATGFSQPHIGKVLYSKCRPLSKSLCQKLIFSLSVPEESVSLIACMFAHSETTVEKEKERILNLKKDFIAMSYQPTPESCRFAAAYLDGLNIRRKKGASAQK